MTQEHISYLLGRHEQEIAAASAALNQAAKVAHSELAYRYSVAVAHAGAGRIRGAEGVMMGWQEEAQLKGLTS